MTKHKTLSDEAKDELLDLLEFCYEKQLQVPFSFSPSIHPDFYNLFVCPPSSSTMLGMSYYSYENKNAKEEIRDGHIYCKTVKQFKDHMTAQIETIRYV